jgi:hypothetical protein
MQPAIARSLTTLRKSLDDYQSALSSTDELSVQDLEASLALLEQTRECLERISQSLKASAQRSEDK